MTKEQTIEQLKSAQSESDGDTEGAHIKADQLLCDFLTHLGYSDVVAEYEKVHKRYA